MRRHAHVQQLVNPDAQQCVHVAIIFLERLFEEAADERRQLEVPAQRAVGHFLNQGAFAAERRREHGKNFRQRGIQ